MDSELSIYIFFDDVFFEDCCFHFLEFFFFFFVCIFCFIKIFCVLTESATFIKTHQKLFVIYKRGFILQGKHVSIFIKQGKPDEDLELSIGGGSEIEIKCFQCRFSFLVQKAEFAHENYPLLK